MLRLSLIHISTDGKPSGAIFGFFKSLHMYLTRFEPNEVVITFDNGHSPVRDKLLPNYKGHRKNICLLYTSNAGGFPGASINVILDKPKAKKTFFMVNLARGYLRMKKSCLLYTSLW